jgi:hypothetical protein
MAARVVKAIGGSRRGLIMPNIVKGRLLGGRRLRRVKMAKMHMARIRKAQVRIAQPKPVSLIMRLTMMGNMTPPNELPEAARPNAIPRFLKNHVGTQEIPAVKMREAPIGEQTAWLRKNW